MFTNTVRQSFYFCILDNDPEYHEVSKGCLSSIFILFNVHSFHSIWSVLNKWKSDFGSFACFPQFIKEHTRSPPLPCSSVHWAGWVASLSWVSFQSLKVTAQPCLCSQHLLDVMRAKLRPRCHLVRWAGPCTQGVETRALVSALLLTSEWPWTSSIPLLSSFIHPTTCSACLARSRLGAGDSR